MAALIIIIKQKENDTQHRDLGQKHIIYRGAYTGNFGSF